MSASPAHIIVGLSGGVDSAVAALLLKRQGHRVSGLFMKNWEEDDHNGHCAAEEDYREVRQLCAILDIPLHTINFSSEYWDRVFRYFLDELKAGRTPNPDVLCNKEIKFKAFLEHALDLGADAIATGHYARVTRRDGLVELRKARDLNKDQSYFLHTLGQKELRHTLFPLAELTKPEVRRIAQDAGLPNYARKDSTGICFIGERNFKEFLARYLPAQPGDMRTLAGGHKGRHDGLMYYTLGQRQGLGIGGAGEAWYVVGKDMQSNTLYVEQGDDHPALYSIGLTAGQLHWTTDAAPSLPLQCRAKTRYRQDDQDCRVQASSGGAVAVHFAQKQRAVTPGQSVVFYADDVCLGGGTIVATEPVSPAATNTLSPLVKSY
jgi:tRNA-specific 2-thiouridylase